MGTPEWGQRGDTGFEGAVCTLWTHGQTSGGTGLEQFEMWDRSSDGRQGGRHHHGSLQPRGGKSRLPGGRNGVTVRDKVKTSLA